jgi:sialate O-acetylesterase
MFFSKLLSSIMLLVLGLGLFAGDFKVADVFADHMVLQRQKAVPIWGWTTPGEEVTVEFKGQKVSAVANQAGKWMVKLTPLKVDSKAAVMSISCVSGKKTIKDILVGEVWICSGQSNMEWAVASSTKGKVMIAAAKNPAIRFLKISHRPAGFPQRGFNPKWQICTPVSVRYFSAVGYYFGLELFNALKVPVGLIESAWGGTRIEPWTPPVGFAAVPQTKTYLNQVGKANKAYQNQLKKCLPHMGKWLAQAKKDLAAGKNIKPLEPAYPNHALNSHRAATGLYNGMIAPLVPFAIRGAIWYQGESNLNDGMGYFYKMQALVKGWRKVWGEGDFPFYFVQIAPYRYGARRSLSALWEAQSRAAKKIKNCDLVFPGDVGNIKNIHPRRKYPVGKRLALLALVNTYDKKITDYKSPAFKSLKVEGNKLVISFENLETGLKTNDGKAPREFMIAGENEKYYPAQAEIKGKTVVISSDKVTAPVSAKYAWHNLSVPNLITNTGLPVLPFQTMQKKENFAYYKSYISSDKNPWGWDSGLTDGSWGVSSNNCFATKSTNKFPKHVTIDLEETVKLSKVKLGVPPFGSTKTVNVEVSTDGKSFTKVGSVVFQQKKAERKTATFPTVEASYLRLTFPDYHKNKVNYDPKFIFITEVEAYEK